jgi:prepilin-type processing-associated H-X9-DG protein
MYVNGNRGRAHVGYGTHENYWGNVLNPYLQGADGVLYCPEATENVGYPAIANTSAYIGTASHAWAQISVVGTFRHESSYGMNGWMSALKPGGSIPMGDAARELYVSLPAPQSEMVPLFGDCVNAAGYPLHADSPPTDLIAPIPTRGNGVGNGIHAFCMARHGRAINVVFLDGHARRVPLEELWRLKWHRHFQPTSVTLPPE